MRKVVFVVCLIVCIVAGSWFGFLWKNEPVPLLTRVISSNADSQQDKAEVETVGIPKRLVINSIQIDIPIEEVGLDSQNRMDVPKNVYNTGWYKFGVKPGETGGALIDGHYDDPQGNPSVFYSLHSLRDGDEIVVYDEYNNKLVFTVKEVSTYAFDKVPMGELIAPSTRKWIHLITCGGEWDQEQENYAERTVVSAVML